ncbi:pyridoxine kinase [Clostridium moniliforme]|uniref:Pyridoxine kinase n=1 Tax=Clostridium moniliforme TaxID=39489 RepID=A0ABS4EXV1_9CLOT|nr:pyridoxamine kinase [Clostridium moniliforme]MBP1888814.1 pyridoxine kinase [Clostridium moniliforme]
MKKPIKRALVIHSLCSVGKASLTNIIPIMSIKGIEVCPIPSVILSTHTGGFTNISKLDSKDFIEKGINSLFSNEIKFDLFFIGYLGDITKVGEIINFLKERENKLVILDTIFGDNGKLYSGFDLKYVEKIRELLKFSYVITPNFTEALYLTGREGQYNSFSYDDIKDIAYDLRKLGAKNIVITSVPCKDNLIEIAVLDENGFNIIYHEKLEKSYPGTGDIFAAVMSAEILNGNSIKDSVKKGSDFVKGCIEYSMKYDYSTKEGVLLEKQLYKLIEK